MVAHPGSIQERMNIHENRTAPTPLIKIVVFLISLWGMYLRVDFRHTHSLWHDEIYQTGPMNGSFLDLIKALPRYEFSAYISGDHYLTYPFYRIFSDNVWGLALPHIAATILSFYFFYLICKRYLTTAAGWVVAFLVFSFNATLIEKAFEIRVYPMLVLLALVSFYVGQMLDGEEFKFDQRKQWPFILFYVLLIWFHPYAIAIAFLPLVYFFGLRLGQASLKAVLWRAVKFFAVVLPIAMPLWIISMFGPHLNVHFSPDALFRYIPSPLVDPIGSLKGIFCNMMGNRIFYFLFLLFPCSWLLPHPDRGKQIWFFLVMVIFPVLLMLGMDLATGYYFIQRQFIWAMPFFVLLIGWCLESLLRNKTGRA